MGRSPSCPRARAVLSLTLLVGLVATFPRAHADPGATSVLAEQLERAVQRRQVEGASTPEADSLYAQAIRAIRARLPIASQDSDPCRQRLMRERLFADLGPLARASNDVWRDLLSGWGELPMAAMAGLAADESLAPAGGDPSQRLLDLVVADDRHFTRGEHGLQIQLRALRQAWAETTVVTRTLLSEYAAGRQQEGNAEYVRLQTELAIALTDLQIAEADNRADDGLLSLLSVLLAQGAVNGIRKQLAATPPYAYSPSYAQYSVDSTGAGAVAVVTAELVLNDPLTLWRAVVPVQGIWERSAPGMRGVRPGDRNGHRNLDAATQLPTETEMLRQAFESLRDSAAVRVRELAGRAALARGAHASRRGHGGEALGYLLIARDLGVQPPAAADFERALTASAALPWSQQGRVKVAPFSVTSPAESPRPVPAASRRSRTPSAARSTAR